MSMSEMVKRVVSVLKTKAYTSPVDMLLGIDDEDTDSDGGTTVLSIDRKEIG